MMKNFLTRIAAAGLLCICMGAALTQAQQQSAETPLTNAAVVKLVRAGFKEKTVIAIIRTRPSQFDLSPDRLIELKRGGVSERIILAMLARDETALTEDNDGWSDDPFFNDSGSSRGQGTQSGSTDIFGSGGGSNARTRGRGTRGGNEDNSQTTGSATVRIIRPQAETGAGGNGAAPPKMERTPTLTNDSVVELVEAGFSEGTIIRRIEQSPADFDLSPPKLTELRKRRVTDRIIAAMSAAMSDAPPPPATP